MLPNSERDYEGTAIGLFKESFTLVRFLCSCGGDGGGDGGSDDNGESSGSRERRWQPDARSYRSACACPRTRVQGISARRCQLVVQLECRRARSRGGHRIVSVVGSSANTSRRRAKPRKFFVMAPDIRLGGRPRYRIENEKTLTGGKILLAPVGRRGFPEYPEAPRVLLDKTLRRPMRDLQLCSSYWLVSDKAKAVLEVVARMAAPSYGVMYDCATARRGRCIGFVMLCACSTRSTKRNRNSGSATSRMARDTTWWGA